jgi:hypothetical protein
MSNVAAWVNSSSPMPDDTDSSIEVSLHETIHMSHARLIVDKLPFTESFLTIDAGATLLC